jgi:sigma-B regulation protein RsbU (phosphoserine phosphatase)
MKKKTGLYLPLIVLFLFTVVVFFQHFRAAPERFEGVTDDYSLPFTANGPVTYVAPTAQAEGLRAGDRFVTINGEVPTNENFKREVDKAGQGAPLNLVVQRKIEGSDEQQTINLTITPVKRNKDIPYVMKIATGFVFVFVLPTFCILLGFWVAFIRPRDPQAWLLLFVMMGMSGIGLEGGGSGRLVNSYSQVFGSLWAPAMLLFAIYFPERFVLDKKAPWLKWILLVPLGFHVLGTLLWQLKTYAGISLIDFFSPIGREFSELVMPLYMLSIGLFFAILGWKSGTLENLDARRRLRLIVIGTTVALSPSFFIIIYSMFTRKTGSFYDRAPWWLALTALLSMVLFPLTMAYVIVVHRAMDVRVVIRQGVQYALASSGVKVLQFVFLIFIILGVIWIFRNFQDNIAAQVGFIGAGFALIPLIEFGAKRLKTWIDKKFFREAYNAEQILSELSEDVRTMVETRPLLETVSNRISESLHVPQVALLLRIGDSFQPAYALGYDAPPAATLGNDDATIEKLRKNQAVMIYQDEESSWTSDDTDEREALRELNSQLLLPVGAKDELAGLISLSPKKSEEPYSANDLRLLKSVAIQTGLALENSRLTEAIANEAAQKERMNRELEIAREVQERLFPQDLPEIEGLEYYGACRPALGVGGDYYDFFELESGKFGIAIGDVSGKGIGASLMMASLQASLRGQAIHSNDDLAGLMVRVNKLVYDTSTTNRYATFFHAQYDPKTKQLIYVNAGHNPPYIIRRSEGDVEVIELKDGGAVVGMLPPILVNYSQGQIELKPGDLLVGFTDGISEAMNPKEEEWGEEAVLAELKTVDGKPCKEILEHIVAAADRFADGAKQHDDMTMIVLRFS